MGSGPSRMLPSQPNTVRSFVLCSWFRRLNPLSGAERAWSRNSTSAWLCTPWRSSPSFSDTLPHIVCFVDQFLHQPLHAGPPITICAILAESDGHPQMGGSYIMIQATAPKGSLVDQCVSDLMNSQAIDVTHPMIDPITVVLCIH